LDFPSYACRPGQELDLLTGALLIARDAYPALDLDHERARLEALSEPLLGQGLEREPALIQARVLGEHLHSNYGFRGNAENYHDPDNSFLNIVLDRRLGIPISLAVVYVTVAERVGVRARGVGFPGHFLVRVDDADSTVVLDPFFGGELLDREALKGLLQRVAPRVSFSDEMLDPAPSRHIVARMLMNLRTLYAARGDAGHLLVVLDRLVDLIPEAYDAIRDRGFLYARLGAQSAAVADLRRYLDALPHADDASDVRRAITQLDASPKLAT
jgi:regulator of sirC expression with transglutaminase-like and TPR domain